MYGQLCEREQEQEREREREQVQEREREREQVQERERERERERELVLSVTGTVSFACLLFRRRSVFGKPKWENPEVYATWHKAIRAPQKNYFLLLN